MKPQRATAAAVCVVLIVTAYSTWYARESLFIDRGDAYADCFVLVSGRHFADHGFAACRFLPIHQPGPLADPPELYTHYPPLPDWINGWQRILLGWDSLFLFRLAPIAAMAGGYWAFFLFCRRFWGPWTAFATLTYLATREMNSALSDSIHGHAYHEALRLAGFLLTVRLGESPTCARRLALLCGLVFLNAWTSYESVLDLQIFAWGYLLWVKRSSVWLPLAASASAAAAFAAQQALNLWAVGPSHFAELAETLKHRVVEGGEWTPFGYLALLADRFNSLAGFHLLLLVPLAGALVYFHRFEEKRDALNVSPLLFLAGVSWWVVFPSHSIIHWFTFRHILPFLAIVIGVVSVQSWALLRDPDRPPLGRIAAAFLLAAAAWAFCSETFLRATPPVRETSEDLVFAEARRMTQSADVILTNWNRVPFVRYGTDRRSERTTTVAEHESIAARLPEGSTPALFLYREDLDHRRDKTSDPLYVSLDLKYDRTDRGQWTVFRLK